MNPNLRVLTLYCYGETPEEDYSATLSAMNIKLVMAKNTTIQNREAKAVMVLFLGDDSPIELTLSALDLLQLESVVGAYGFYEDH